MSFFTNYHPWIDWGFWDYFFLVSMSSVVFGAYVIAVINERHKKREGR